MHRRPHLQRQRFALVGAVFFGFGAVCVEDVAHAVGGVAEFFGVEGAGEVDELLFGGVQVLGWDGGGDLLEFGDDRRGLGGMHRTVVGEGVGRVGEGGGRVGEGSGDRRGPAASPSPSPAARARAKKPSTPATPRITGRTIVSRALCDSMGHLDDG